MIDKSLARTSFIDQRTGLVAREWLRYLEAEDKLLFGLSHWIDWVPSFSATGMGVSTSGAAALSAQYLKWGSSLYVNVSAGLVTSGTPTNEIVATIPFTAKAVNFQTITCAVSIDGAFAIYAPGFAFISPGSNLIRFRKGDNTNFPIGNVGIGLSGIIRVK